MAFPFDQTRDAPALGDDLVEDLVMGLEMALSGHVPLFCAAAKVQSSLPERAEAARAQRTRWEHGQLSTLLSHGPKLLAESIRQRRPELAALALDLAAPPLALSTSGLAASLAASSVIGTLARKPSLAMTPSVLGLVLVGAGTLAAWLRYGRDPVSLGALALAPLYVAWKTPPICVSGGKGARQKAWVRTER